jgi:hypothetical protein
MKEEERGEIGGIKREGGEKGGGREGEGDGRMWRKM